MLPHRIEPRIVTSSRGRSRLLVATIAALPGLGLSAAVAVLAYIGAPYVALIAPVPAMVLALIIGIALNPIAAKPVVQPGMAFCVKTVLRWSVALLGLRVGLSDISALGFTTAALIVGAMIVTVVSGFFCSRILKQPVGIGALIGVGTAVCGASAALAVSTVIPDYRNKKADLAFTVVALNALATIAMLIYPPLCVALGFDAQTTGIMLGGTIHDVAQVAGAGYAVSSDTGNVAVIVKLFRVFLLLPTVLAVAFYFSRLGAHQGPARVAFPAFAVVFVILCALNSAMPHLPGLPPGFALTKHVLVEASMWGLLLAISALGLDTSIRTLVGLGWRHGLTVAMTTIVILLIVCAGIIITGAYA